MIGTEKMCRLYNDLHKFLISKHLYANNYIANYLKISHHMEDHDNKIPLLALYISTRTSKNI